MQNEAAKIIRKREKVAKHLQRKQEKEARRQYKTPTAECLAMIEEINTEITLAMERLAATDPPYCGGRIISIGMFRKRAVWMICPYEYLGSDLRIYTGDEEIRELDLRQKTPSELETIRYNLIMLG